MRLCSFSFSYSNTKRPISMVTLLLSVTLSGSLFVHSQEEELVNRCMSPSTAGVTSFKLHDRAKHVYSEAARVLKFKSVCEEKPANAVQVTYYSMVLVTCFPVLGTGCMFSRT